MEQLLLKAVTTAADQGAFEAVISTATIDRERDIVDANAMVIALQKWVQVDKRIPLLWNHSTDPEDLIGHIDPASAKNVNGEVVVNGWIDQSIKRGEQIWRLVKSGTLGFSFGYLITSSTKRKGGGRHITGLDVFEATATSIPMNGDTRVLSWKSADEAAQVIKELQAITERLERLEKAQEKSVEEAGKAPEARSVDPLRKRAQDLAMEVMSDGVPATPPETQDTKASPRPEPAFEPAELRRYTRDLMVQTLSGS